VAVPAAATTTLALTVSGTSAVAQLSTSTGAPANGSVNFVVDGTALGAQPVTANQATAAIPAGLPIGEHTVTATYSSDNTTGVGNAEASASFTVAKTGSSVTASVDKASVRYGDQETVTIVVTGAAPGVDLSGPVTVHDESGVLVEGAVDASGQTSLSFLNRAEPGSKDYTVSYAGNDAVEASASQLQLQTGQTNADISIDWADGPLPGTDVAITADVVGTPDSPTGTATITYDGAPIANGPVDASGKITGTASAVVAGDHQIQVSYAGDVRFEPNTATATLTVKEPVANPNQAGAAAVQSSNPCPAAASACIDLSNEQAWLQSGGQITYGPVPITSGAAGSRTRTGMFSVFWRDKNHKSTLFNNAPMPNSVFFDGDIAFHQGSLSYQSNGCIHLSWDASETFFDTLSVGDGVYVWGAAPY